MMKKHFGLFSTVCVAVVCMTTLLSGNTMAAEGDSPFMELAKKRFSVRQFADKPVPKDLLIKVLEAGNVAPTAKNLQPHRIHVLTKAEDLAKLDTVSPCRYGAPVVLVFSYNSDEEWKHSQEPGVHSGVEDVSIVATHIMLQAAELGLGTTWVNMFRNSQLEKLFELPANEKTVLIMPIGFPAENAKPSRMHTTKKPLDKTVIWH